jgi:hypothetical protein
MAKKTSKTKKVTKKKVEAAKSESASEENKPVQAEEPKNNDVNLMQASYHPDMINIAFSKEEIDTFTNLLSIFAHNFQQLALSAAENNDDKSFNILSTRHKLFTMLAGKLAMSSSIGEPTSRDIH